MLAEDIKASDRRWLGGKLDKKAWRLCRIDEHDRFVGCTRLDYRVV
jgi:hypothetical protein